MRVRVSHPELLDDLIDFLRGSDCVAERADDETIEVGLPGALDADQARLEVDLYLRVWQATNPQVDAAIVG